MLRRYATLHVVVRLAQKVCVLMSTKPVFIDLAHRSDSGCSEVSQCIRVYSTCRQCRNATVALANNSGLPGHHRLVVETVSASTTPCCW